MSKVKAPPINVLDLIAPISAKTPNQKLAILAYNKGQNLLLTGFPGTGKTFIAMAMALQSVKRGEQSRIIVVRSAVATRNIGYLPGKLKEKMEEYERPYVDMCNNLFDVGTRTLSPYHVLIRDGILELMSTSYVRGITINHAVIILDEFQNMTEHELHSVLSRVGEGCRVIISGDITQTDLEANRSGFARLVNVLDAMQSFTQIDFDISDIVRSDFAKTFILCWSLTEPIRLERHPRHDFKTEDVSTQPTARARTPVTAG